MDKMDKNRNMDRALAIGKARIYIKAAFMLDELRYGYNASDEERDAVSDESFGLALMGAGALVQQAKRELEEDSADDS